MTRQWERTSLFSCCKHGNDPWKYANTGRDYDLIDIDVQAGPTTVGLSLGAYAGTSHPYWGDRIPRRCYTGISMKGTACGGSAGAVSLCSYLEGSVTFDWNPPGEGYCREVQGCMCAGIEVDLGPVSFDLGKLCRCVTSGKYLTRQTVWPWGQCYRSYAALSFGVHAGNSLLGGIVSGNLYLKFWFPEEGCDNQYHFDPYFQLDTQACAFFTCHHLYSGKIHFLGAEPGRAI